MRCPLLGLALASLASSAACQATPTPLLPGFSGSVGWPHHGVQTGAIELPESGPGFVRYRRNGGYNWGQPSLVHTLRAAALRVSEQLPGGGPLVVGDLSARQGGKVSRHASHRSGRDADLLWYMTTPEGAPIANAHFVQVGADGLGRSSDPDATGGGYVRLDVAREWLLVKSLLDAELLAPTALLGSSERVHVQWMFVSRDIEALLIDYALASDEDPELIWRAENVLQEPPEGLPHDDHLHLRLACSPNARMQGCESGGPYWSWLPSAAELQAFDGLDAEETDQL